MLVSRLSVTTSACALLMMTAGAGAEPYHHGKTIKQCNEELAAGRAALTAAGESPAKFIHDCWWQTKAGEPTPIPGTQASPPDETAAKLKTADEAIAKAHAEADAAKAEAARAKQDAVDARKAIEAAKNPAPKEKQASDMAQSDRPATSTHVVGPRAAGPGKAVRRNVARRLVRRPVFAPARLVERVPSDAFRDRRLARPVADRVTMPAPAGQQAEGEALARMDWVPVHIATMPQPIKWPVLPEFVPSFRYVVNHPIVPGFTWTP